MRGSVSPVAQCKNDEDQKYAISYSGFQSSEMSTAVLQVERWNVQYCNCGGVPLRKFILANDPQFASRPPDATGSEAGQRQVCHDCESEADSRIRDGLACVADVVVIRYDGAQGFKILFRNKTGALLAQKL